MKETDINRVYLLGAGGIGMSALARYFRSKGKHVAGYDRVLTPLTDLLINEGINIHFSDDVACIPDPFMNKHQTLVIYTPAIPALHHEFQYFRENGYEIMKRSQVLGMIMKQHTSIAVAGTHGKTTTTSMLAHIFSSSGLGCNAFLGGIARNFNSNLVLDKKSDYFIAEADEFDRSFLSLFPDYAVVTSADDDHMDVYGERKNLVASFNQFISQIKPNGVLVVKNGLDLISPEGIRIYKYSMKDETDYYAFNLKKDGIYDIFSIHTPFGDIQEIKLGVAGKLNIENAVASCAIAQMAGIGETAIRTGLGNFQGVVRRFDIRVNDDKVLFIDDYAHHPEELKAFINSVKEIAPGKRIMGVFQPHLYSRTRDLADDFAESLSLIDDVILLDIYPAREIPVPGVSSEMIYNKLHNDGKRIMCSREQLLSLIVDLKPEVLLCMGAGDIDQLVEPISEMLTGIKR